MITNSKFKMNYIDGNAVVEVELTGLSSDTKPTKVDGVDIMNGSTFFEMDTSTAYMFNQDTQSWVEL